MGDPYPLAREQVEASARQKEFEFEVVLTRLREAESKYRGLFENSVEGIFQSTPAGRYLNVNPALARMLGYESPAELIATVTDIGRQICVRPESREAFKRRLERDGYARNFENEIYRKDGSIACMSVNARVVRDAAGVVLYYEGTCRDISQRRRAEVQLA